MAAVDGASAAIMLLVDDDPMVLRTLGRALQRRGLTVEAVGSANEALARCRQRSYDAIVSDLMMPGMTGMDLEAALARERPHLRDCLIILTGGAVTPDAAAFTERSDVRSFMKPVDVGAPVATVTGFVR